MRVEYLDELFDAIMDTVSDKSIRELLTDKQKLAVLDALGVIVEESDTQVVLSFLFIKFTANLETGAINVSIDGNALLNATEQKGK